MKRDVNRSRFGMRPCLLIVLSALLASGGCQSLRTSSPPGRSGQTPDASNTTVRAQLRAGLTVNVQVLVTGQKEIDEKNRRISELGVITLPLVGEVRVVDLTIAEAQTLLKKAYGRFYVAPEVIVECLMETGDTAVSPWGYVTVLGRVKKPGQINVPPTRELTVSRAIQLAGGLDSSARSKAIRVTRTHDNTTEQFEVDLDRVGSRGEAKDDMRLLPGDIVYVPEAVL